MLHLDLGRTIITCVYITPVVHSVCFPNSQLLLPVSELVFSFSESDKDGLTVGGSRTQSAAIFFSSNPSLLRSVPPQNVRRTVTPSKEDTCSLLLSPLASFDFHKFQFPNFCPSAPGEKKAGGQNLSWVGAGWRFGGTWNCFVRVFGQRLSSVVFSNLKLTFSV